MTDGATAATAAIDRLFRAHATPLLRLATALTGDRGVAEDLVQDAFVALARQPQPPGPAPSSHTCAARSSTSPTAVTAISQ